MKALDVACLFVVPFGIFLGVLLNDLEPENLSWVLTYASSGVIRLAKTGFNMGSLVIMRFWNLCFLRIVWMTLSLHFDKNVIRLQGVTLLYTFVLLFAFLSNCLFISLIIITAVQSLYASVLHTKTLKNSLNKWINWAGRDSLQNWLFLRFGAKI